jgi:hypothetical protein
MDHMEINNMKLKNKKKDITVFGFVRSGKVLFCNVCPHFVPNIGVSLKKGMTVSTVKPLILLIMYGGPEMTRTSDSQFRKLQLYPLSYGANVITSSKISYSVVFFKFTATSK